MMLVLFLALTTPVMSAADNELPIEVIEREIEQTAASYLEVDSYRLTFSQESYWALADSSFATRAVLTARAPDMLSIRYDDGGRVVASAGTLRVFIPQTNQFFISHIGSNGLTIDPASILQSYHLRPKEPVISHDSMHLCISLVPENRFMDPSRVDVTIDRVRHVVVRLSAHATSGDRSTYIIERTELAPVVPDSEFELEPPPGAAVQSGSPYDHGDIGS